MDGKETAVNGVAWTGRAQQGKASNGREGNSSEWSRIPVRMVGPWSGLVLH